MNSEVIKKIINDEEFMSKYLDMFLDRFVYQTLEIEGTIDKEERKKQIDDLLNGFNVIMNMSFEKISPFEIQKIGDCVNNDKYSGFRKINVLPGKYANWEPVEPKMIIPELYNLINNYYNVWSERDIFEKEALFHIWFMRIHPFEDGNKRIGKIILNANLLKQNTPPVLIDSEYTEKYYEYINNEDVKGFAHFLKAKSYQEYATLLSYYKVEKNIPINESLVNYFAEQSRH